MATCQELLSALGCYISKQGSDLFEFFKDKLTLSGQVLHITKIQTKVRYVCRGLNCLSTMLKQKFHDRIFLTQVLLKDFSKWAEQ